MEAINARKVILNILPFISVGLLIFAWVSFSSDHPNLLATPEMVFERTVRMFERPVGGMNPLGHMWVSMRRILIALFFALVLGILIGLIMAVSKTGNAIVGTLYTFIKPIPPLAWVPMMTVWFGIGELAKIILVTRGGIVPITDNTNTGVRLADPHLIDVGKVARASQFQIFRHIILLAALPSIIAGFKNALTNCFMVVLAAEMMGAQAGLGFLITRGIMAVDPAVILVGMISIGIVGALLSAFASNVERVTCPWIRTIN